MPTISGLRRRGYTPSSIRRFCEEIGVAKTNSMVDIEFLQFCIREELNKTANRVMAVLKPLRVVIENYPEDRVEELDALDNPESETPTTRKIPFSRVLFIEQDDFMENPPKGYFRLSPGKEVRLKHAYFITCKSVVRDEEGRIVELRCEYDPSTRGGEAPDGRKVKGTLHWVSAAHAVEAEVRLYDHLFTLKNLDELEPGKEYRDYLNPDSLVVLSGCKVEPGLLRAEAGQRFQFLRHGYFCVDPDSGPEHLVFNRIVSLKDSWAKEQKKD
jgi:glutaminyl-tRNA synthetase